MLMGFITLHSSISFIDVSKITVTHTALSWTSSHAMIRFYFIPTAVETKRTLNSKRFYVLSPSTSVAHEGPHEP